LKPNERSFTLAEQSLALREQFATPEQQRESATLGMWIFIVTESMLFGGTFAAFAGYHHWYPAAFNRGSSEMELTMGAVNTAVLICSSFTMSLAEYFAARGKPRFVWFLVLTALIGTLFLGIKFTEYYMHYKDHKLPGFGFQDSSPQSRQVQLFFFLYFVMTGLHSVHLLIGIVLVLLMLIPALIYIDENYSTPIHNISLYWHFVDVIWVFLYAIFYLPGAHLK
jgi:cytochrome c oxidase subunit III